jgi:hypothetical protein
MFLQGSFLNISFLGNVQPKPTKKTYNKIQYFGDITIDKVKIINYEMTDEELDNINVLNSLIWSPDTLFLAEFENGLGAGNVEHLNSPILSWQINRKEEKESTFKKLGVVDVNTVSFIDWKAQTDKNYTYDIIPITATEIGNALEVADISPYYTSWFLIDEQNNLSYEFYLNFEGGDLENVTDFTVMDNYTKYPSFNIGKRDYVKGTVSFIIGDIVYDGLDQTVELLDNFKKFINNGKEKIFKSRKGNIWNVMTMNYKEKVLNNNLIEEIKTIEFDFIESSEVI